MNLKLKSTVLKFKTTQSLLSLIIINISSISGDNLILNSVWTKPALLNKHSEGTDVAGMHYIALANFVNLGNSFEYCW